MPFHCDGIPDMREVFVYRRIVFRARRFIIHRKRLKNRIAFVPSIIHSRPIAPQRRRANPLPPQFLPIQRAVRPHRVDFALGVAQLFEYGDGVLSARYAGARLARHVGE